MYYEIRAGGKVYDVECDPTEIEDKRNELDGVLGAQAETLEQYTKRKAKGAPTFNWI